MSVERIVAVGLLTEGDLARLGTSFGRAFPVHETPCFTQLLHDIDDADRNWIGRQTRPELRVEPVAPFPVIGRGRD